jgi:YD repeat-containing protein
MTNPDGGVTQYAYDARNRMVSLTNPFSETTGWTYDAGGRVTRLSYGNGAYTLYGYDNARQVVSIQHCKSDGTPIWSMAYTYDPAGNRTQLAETDASVTNCGWPERPARDRLWRRSSRRPIGVSLVKMQNNGR